MVKLKDFIQTLKSKNKYYITQRQATVGLLQLFIFRVLLSIINELIYNFHWTENVWDQFVLLIVHEFTERFILYLYNWLIVKRKFTFQNQKGINLPSSPLWESKPDHRHPGR